jgi:drug/metabolite transporter (DMT)-like permease
MSAAPAPSVPPALSATPAAVPGTETSRAGPWLVLAAAVVWSFGGVFARLLGDLDPWTTIFWRSVFAAAFLAAFMLWRDGAAGTHRLFAAMGAPGLGMAVAFAVASTSFVAAIQHTTVANVLLIQAGVPLIAALMAWALFGERAAGPTWAAIAATLVGVVVMVSPSLGGAGAPLGDALGVVVALAFASATVIARRFAGVRMAPAVCLGMLLAAAFAASRASGFAIDARETALLFGFGALNLGLGLALFVTGARLTPAAVAALLGVAETMLGPLWVALFLGEVPGPRTLLGGGIVLAALVGHILWQLARAPRPG